MASSSSVLQSHSRVRIGHVGSWNPELNSRSKRCPVRNGVSVSSRSRRLFLSGMECGPKPLSSPSCRVSWSSGEGRSGFVGGWTTPEVNSRWRRFPVEENALAVLSRPFCSSLECGWKPLSSSTSLCSSSFRVSCSSGEGGGSARVAVMSDAEQAGWEQRQKEAASSAVDPFQWRWTLNWDAITSQIIVGSCPRSPADIDRLVDETGIDAVLNLQSGLCFDALDIPYDALRRRAVERGLFLNRVEIRDFDHADQSLMLPVAVRLLNALLARGMKVYVHCTAGINRATLTTVGHLTFVQQMDLEDAVAMVKSARPVAHPYIDCWKEVRRRLLEGRREEVTRISEEVYETRVSQKTPGTKLSDWVAAEKRVIAQTFQRYLDTDLAMLDMETACLKRKMERKLKAGGGGGGNGSAAH